MTTKTIGGLLAVMACGAMMTIAGCESGGTDPANSPRTGGGTKLPDALTDCENIFTGIEHCAIGSAHLDADAAAATVVVTDFDTDGDDGVSSSFSDEAMEWSQRSTTDFGTRTNAYLHYEAISDGQAVSKLHITRVSSTTLHYTPTFTAADGGNSRFHAHVYNNGVLLGGQEGIDPQTPVGIVSAPDQEDRDGGFKRRRPHKGTQDKNDGSRRMSTNDWEVAGACEWSEKATSPTATFSVRLPNGTLLDGDEVLFTEEVAAGQAVYNDFQRIDMTGNLESYTILNESSVPVE